MTVNIYYFDRTNIDFDNIHSFIMETFGKNAQSPSLKTPNFFVVQTEKHFPHLNFYKLEKQNQFSELDLVNQVHIETTVAFDNRHGKGSEALRRKIYPQESIEKFCHLSGLKPVDGEFQDAQFSGSHVENKFSIMNAFRIEGLFCITDLKKFNHALRYGIGSRKSYGFGLVLIKEVLCHP